MSYAPFSPTIFLLFFHPLYSFLGSIKCLPQNLADPLHIYWYTLISILFTLSSTHLSCQCHFKKKKMISKTILGILDPTSNVWVFHHAVNSGTVCWKKSREGMWIREHGATMLSKHTTHPRVSISPTRKFSRPCPSGFYRGLITRAWLIKSLAIPCWFNL